VKASWLRSILRILLFPVVVGAGTILGILAVVTHPGLVLRRLRRERTNVFDSFSPEEKKVLAHVAIGFACLGLAVALAGLAFLLWH